MVVIGFMLGLEGGGWGKDGGGGIEAWVGQQNETIR